MEANLKSTILYAQETQAFGMCMQYNLKVISEQLHNNQSLWALVLVSSHLLLYKIVRVLFLAL